MPDIRAFQASDILPLHLAEIRVLQIGCDQCRPVKNRPVQVCPAEVGFAQSPLNHPCIATHVMLAPVDRDSTETGLGK